jgi:hypothetical protein
MRNSFAAFIALVLSALKTPASSASTLTKAHNLN